MNWEAWHEGLLQPPSVGADLRGVSEAMTNSVPGNPYAHIDEEPARPVVDVQLPRAEDDSVPPPNPR